MKQRTVILLIWLFLGALLVYKTNTSPIEWLKESKEVILQLMKESGNGQESE
jgi:hypothetical protein